MCRTSQAVATALLLLVPGLCAAQSVNMGSTFHGLEARARRVTTTFPDAWSKCVGARARRWRRSCGIARAAPRPARLQVDARLAPRAVARRARRRPRDRVRPAGAGNGQPRLGGVPAVRAARRRGRGHRRATSTWLASTAHGTATSGATGARCGRGDVGRPVGRPGRAGRNRVRRRRGACRTRSARRARTGAARGSTTRDSPRRILDRRTGARRGFVRWFDTAQVLTWKIEGGSQGVILPERMRGGWTFTPTMAWANVQAYQFATQAARTLEPGRAVRRPRGLFGAPAHAARRLRRSPARWRRCRRPHSPCRAPWPARAAARRAGPRRRVGSAVAFGGRSAAAAASTSPAATTSTGWTGRSSGRAAISTTAVTRRTGCSSGSWWWPFAGTWSCQRCNAQVAYCFCTLANPAYCGGSVGSSGGDGGAERRRMLVGGWWASARSSARPVRRDDTAGRAEQRSDTAYLMGDDRWRDYRGRRSRGVADRRDRCSGGTGRGRARARRVGGRRVARAMGWCAGRCSRCSA